ncbi:class D sortase [Pseudalkalibacillus caeni]|uniref:Class D sortase n=1 Tax=Exobacillus caeni TaxID=2574798 RepID=A0A5R9FC29_9BACL|nr:class D sortase [Pseudalkalibacillus caeni]TLS37205.1 class D sortase [Pseudalkalibacillus caeni]
MRKWIGLLAIVVGLAVALPNAYQWWKQRHTVEAMSNSELNEYLSYDDTVREPVKKLPGSKDEIKLEKGQEVAHLLIPSIESKYPVYWGTDPETLKQGVGMHDSKWTVTPEETGHVLLAGHRDTVFTEMGDVKIGDMVTVKYHDKEYTYQVRKTFITEAEDRSVVVKKEEPLLTISTCYPFEFVGDAPYRYIIQSELISVK